MYVCQLQLRSLVIYGHDKYIVCDNYHIKIMNQILTDYDHIYIGMVKYQQPLYSMEIYIAALTWVVCPPVIRNAIPALLFVVRAHSNLMIVGFYKKRVNLHIEHVVMPMVMSSIR